jgi:hypothetical protein
MHKMTWSVAKHLKSQTEHRMQATTAELTDPSYPEIDFSVISLQLVLAIFLLHFFSTL